MQLKKLLKNIPTHQIKGSKDIEITGICSDSKRIAPGNLFIARRGKVHDGNQYIPEAISAGAVAVLSDIYDPSIKDITQIIHSDVSATEALLAAHYYQFASDSLFMVGITGTNGKTTSSFIVKHLLDSLNGPCGLIGTVEYIIGNQRHPATRTTPDIVSNHKMLRDMVTHGCRSAVMEVTTHALDQGRNQYIEYDVAIFTNLSIDHLDYHLTMENYAQTKNKLFSSLICDSTAHKRALPKWAIINLDSPWQSKMREGCKANILSYGLEGNADLRATEIQMTGHGTTFNITYKGKKVPCKSPLVGRYNVYNVLAAIGVGLARSIPLEIIVPLIQTFSPVAGRLEPIQNELGLKIYVDFAHSDDALTNVLECLQELKQDGKIITVFGCGGDRDKTKRPRMAQAAEALSDLCIVTTDNPRSEDPTDIITQITKGFQHKDTYVVELDRYAAIQRAIDMATCSDIVLIAGKGHEPYQVFAHKIIEFDDRKVANQICQRKLQTQKAT